MAAAELEEALRETLEAKGALSRLRASIRAEVFGAMDDENERRAHPNPENLVINDLIREYLEFNHYTHTLSVFMPETGQPNGTIDREYMSERTGLQQQSVLPRGDAREPRPIALPLLYSLLAPAAAGGGRGGVAASQRGVGEGVRMRGLAREPPTGRVSGGAHSRARAPSTRDGGGMPSDVPGSAVLRTAADAAEMDGGDMPAYGRALGGGAPDPLVFSH